MDFLPIGDKNKFYKRRGKFDVSIFLLLDSPSELIRIVWSKILVVGRKWDEDNSRCIFFGYSELFREVEEAEPAPYYHIIVSHDEKGKAAYITAKEIEKVVYTKEEMDVLMKKLNEDLKKEI